MLCCCYVLLFCLCQTERAFRKALANKSSSRSVELPEAKSSLKWGGPCKAAGWLTGLLREGWAKTFFLSPILSLSRSTRTDLRLTWLLKCMRLTIFMRDASAASVTIHRSGKRCCRWNVNDKKKISRTETGHCFLLIIFRLYICRDGVSYSWEQDNPSFESQGHLELQVLNQLKCL